MQVTAAKSAGFCGGVHRSMEMARRALEQGECWCLGPLIHNAAALHALQAQGLRIAETVEQIPAGARVLIRAHGVPDTVRAALRKRAAELIDTTCPRVQHVHDLVRQAAEQGRVPVVIGQADHPEIRAVTSPCAEAVVCRDDGELADWLGQNGENHKRPLTVVFQTTQTRKIIVNCEILLKKECTNFQLFDTMCNATSVRQEEAARLAAECSAMIVIGDPLSANSRRLAEICAEHCSRVQFIPDAAALDLQRLRGCRTVGLTAGASTPSWIIKEVKQKMCDEIRANETPIEKETEKSFEELLEESIKTIYNGDTVTGIVAAITPTEISVDLGTKHSGYIPVAEYCDDPNVKIEELVKVGDPIEAVVVRVNDVEGTVMLSKKRLDAVKFWADIEAAKEEGTVVEGTVTEENKGGVVVSVSGVRVFVPASQSGLPKEAAMSELMGQKVRLKITEVNRGRRRVVGSIRAVLNKERKEKAEKIWNEIEIGKHYDGVVKSMTSYGAFVDIGGIDGMVHVSELSWSRIKQPSDVLSVGDHVNVYVLGFDKENRKISLGYRNPDENPWARFMAQYEVGSVAKVKIVKLMTFGAFAEVLPGVDGLIHISQIANRRIGQPSEVLSVGDEVEAKITAIDPDKQKISLSIRALSEPEPAPRKEEVREEPRGMEADALVYEVSATGEATGNAPETDAE